MIVTDGNDLGWDLGWDGIQRCEAVNHDDES